jgi:tetratricopeptide (TPR) repeat protein
MQSYDFKHFVLITKTMLTVLLVAYIVTFTLSCATTEPVQNNTSSRLEDTSRRTANTNTQRNTVNTTDASPLNEVITVNYLNESSNIQIKLDPSKEQFYLDLRGMRPADKDSIVVIDSSIVQSRAKDIQMLLTNYRKAQDLFYLEEYRQSLDFIDKTLEIQETADAYALKGTIFFMLENITAARANWNRAVQMDPNIPIPSIPELETLIQEIRRGQ